MGGLNHQTARRFRRSLAEGEGEENENGGEGNRK